MTHTVNQMPASKVDAAPLCWLLPPRCIVCDAPGKAGVDLCVACLAALPRQGPACPRCALPQPDGRLCASCLQTPPPVDTAHAAFTYAFPLDRLLPRLKFHGDFAAGRVMALAMADSFAALPPPQALVPVPLHASRLRTRGYDQALELARPLARALGLPVRCDLLERCKPTRAQSTLDADARQRNLRGAFRLHPEARLPTHVALFDDVMTTGATLHAAAAVLRAAGVQRIDAWACARVP
jgi:ComF family protein